MRAQPISPVRVEPETKESWLPMVVIALGQVLMSFNVASLPVAIGGGGGRVPGPTTTAATRVGTASLPLARVGMPLGQQLRAVCGPGSFFTAVPFSLAA